MTVRQRLFRSLFCFACLLALSGCAETEFLTHYAKKISWPGEKESAGSYKIGQPYRVGGIWYYPKEDFSLVETGIASWYGPDFHGGPTANGELYDQNELTAAHRTLQMPSLVRVTNLENGRSLVVRVNDRGPFKRGRIIDLSKRGAELLGFIDKGTARVRLEVLERESQELAAAARRGVDTTRLTRADLNRASPSAQETPIVIPAADSAATSPPRRTMVASLEGDPDLPESLRTPTITVEELTETEPEPIVISSATTPQPAHPVVSPAAVDRAEFISRLNLGMVGGQKPAIPQMAPGRVERGHFMPAPVVSQAPVRPTGIFVQAGSFSVQGNAERLRGKLGAIARVSVDPVVVSGRTLYRVRLGPLSSVAEADKVLARVLQAGGGDAKVIRN